MAADQKPIPEEEYERMAVELVAMSKSIAAHPEMNHHFAERLALLAKQMREDIRIHRKDEKRG
jgi:hypothetical protein